jgi:hypothetical protein
VLQRQARHRTVDRKKYYLIKLYPNAQEYKACSYFGLLQMAVIGNKQLTRREQNGMP